MRLYRSTVGHYPLVTGAIITRGNLDRHMQESTMWRWRLRSECLRSQRKGGDWWANQQKAVKRHIRFSFIVPRTQPCGHWYWTSSIQNWEKINFCFLTHIKCSNFCSYHRELIEELWCRLHFFKCLTFWWVFMLGCLH